MRDEQVDTEIRGWFKDHEASLCVLNHLAPYLNGRTLWWLRWRKPKTTIYWIDYVMTADGRLMVTGDLGGAIYQWYFGHLDSAHRDDPLVFAAGCNLDYFASKCVASEEGYQYREWCEKEAQEALEFWANEDDDDRDRRRKILNDAAFPALSAASEEGRWQDWLRLLGEDAFGIDYYELAGIGYVVHLRCRAHLIGLKMAMEQIKMPDIT